MTETQSQRWLKYGVEHGHRHGRRRPVGCGRHLRCRAARPPVRHDRRRPVHAQAANLAGDLEDNTAADRHHQLLLQGQADRTPPTARPLPRPTPSRPPPSTASRTSSPICSRSTPAGARTSPSRRSTPSSSRAKADALIAAGDRQVRRRGRRSTRTSPTRLAKKFDAISKLGRRREGQGRPPPRNSCPTRRPCSATAEILGTVGEHPRRAQGGPGRSTSGLLAQKPPDYKGVTLSVTAAHGLACRPTCSAR